MAAWADIIAASLQDLGVIAAGETPSAEDQQIGLQRLNGLLDQWAAERLQIYSITRTTWAIVTTVGTYTVGAGGTVNIARPVYVEAVNVLDTSVTPNVEIQMQPMTDSGYMALPIKGLAGATFPANWWYNPTYPLGTLVLWPAPTNTNLRGVIYHPTALTVVSDVNDTYALPPGYRRMIETALAVELASAFEREPDATLVQRARSAMMTVKRANVRMSDLNIDPAALGQVVSRADRYSIFTGP